MSASRPRLRGVLFDHDGTLVDSLAVVVEATNRVLPAWGAAVLPRDEIVRGMALPTAPRMGSHARTDDAATQALLAEAFYVAAREVGPGLARLYPRVLDCLAALAGHGLRLAVVSNNDAALIAAIARALGLDRHVAVLIGEQDMEQPKPHPSGALLAARRLGLDPAQCCFVGDSRADSGAAAAAGMRSVGVTWGIHRRDEMLAMGFDQLVDSTDQLAALIAGWTTA
jgi:phosphoglycolate phosphatase